MEFSLLAAGSTAVGFVAGMVAAIAIGSMPISRPVTSMECEEQLGNVVILSGAEVAEAVCLKNGEYWPVRVDIWTRYTRAYR